MDFGKALEALKEGKKVSREGWNGKGQFVYYVPEDRYPAKTEAAKSIADEDGMVTYRAYLALKTVQGDIATWVPSISDILATDWIIHDGIKTRPFNYKDVLWNFLNSDPVGNTMKIKFKDGKEYEIVKYHDGVIGTRDCPFGHVMNEDWKKEADWNTCDMKPFIEKWFDDNAPDELKKLWSVTIPCGTNIWGDKYKGRYYNDDESEIQWDYFKDWHNRVKTILDKSANEEGWWYWTKSKFAGHSNYFVLVPPYGSANFNYANNTYGVALCFLKK